MVFLFSWSLGRINFAKIDKLDNYCRLSKGDSTFKGADDFSHSCRFLDIFFFVKRMESPPHKAGFRSDHVAVSFSDLDLISQIRLPIASDLSIRGEYQLFSSNKIRAGKVVTLQSMLLHFRLRSYDAAYGGFGCSCWRRCLSLRQRLTNQPEFPAFRLYALTPP